MGRARRREARILKVSDVIDGITSFNFFDVPYIESDHTFTCRMECQDLAGSSRPPSFSLYNSKHIITHGISKSRGTNFQCS